MANKEPIQTSDAPAAIGPYSQAIKSGPFVFLSGQIPLDPDFMELVGSGSGPVCPLPPATATVAHVS